jgi:hypothetical protein
MDWGYEVDEVESRSRPWDVRDACMLWTQKDMSDARSILRAPKHSLVSAHPPSNLEILCRNSLSASRIV